MQGLKEKRVYLLDMDGTIYLGDTLIDGTIDFLNTLKEKDKKYIFLTNNSSKNSQEYVKKLKLLGIDVVDEDIITSGQATKMYLKKRKRAARVYLLGNKSLEEEFEKEGFILERDRNKTIDYVVIGMDTTLTYEKLWIACEYISKGIEYVATHLDSNCLIEDGKFMPDAGAIAAFIKESTGKSPIVAGKPNEEIVDSVISKYNFKKEEMVMIGDYLPTDIQLGKNSNITSVLVYSGETKEKDYKKSETRADYVFDSIKDMIELI